MLAHAVDLFKKIAVDAVWLNPRHKFGEASVKLLPAEVRVPLRLFDATQRYVFAFHAHRSCRRAAVGLSCGGTRL